MADMRIPQYQVRTLLLLTAMMGVLFVVCARWPVTDVRTPLTVSLSGGGTLVASRATIVRPPTNEEWMIRAGLMSGILLAALVLVGVWRAKRAKD
jgi:hypothetical protein